MDPVSMAQSLISSEVALTRGNIGIAVMKQAIDMQAAVADILAQTMMVPADISVGQAVNLVV